ncbi:MAG: magnesium transporter [Thermoanaerobaculia bacterium]|nr:MAG: magnesium transporter [Thermoanaerobaculia bacterium]
MSEPRPGSGRQPGFEPDEAARSLATRLAYLPPDQAAATLAGVDDERAAGALSLLTPATAFEILWELEPGTRARVAAAAPGGRGEHWLLLDDYEEGTIGRLMDRPLALFRPGTTVGEAIDRLRELTRRAHIVYGFVTDDAGRLVGVFAFRELLFARPDQTLAEVMVSEPFALRPEATVLEAARAVVTLHVPAYPVCDTSGRLIGMVRGRTLFEQEAIEISAQAGRLVGVDKEERFATRWPRSLRFRHPWLQLNLFTAFLAAGVVGFFQDTIDQIVVLAMFLPVLAGQSGNTGCQALAVTLRGLTLGELELGAHRRLFAKEAWLGLLNGALVGLVAGGGMVFVASSQGRSDAWTLGAVVLAAMTGSCAISGVSGALVPLALRRLGADPATASSIFLTTATDVVSMGLLLGLATLLLR